MATTTESKVAAIRAHRLHLAANLFNKLKAESDAAAERTEKAKAVLLEGMVAGERIVLDEETVIAKEEASVLDVKSGALQKVIDGEVPHGYKKCLVEKFSVEKLHALESLYPALAKVLEKKGLYVPQPRIQVRKPTPEERTGFESVKAAAE